LSMSSLFAGKCFTVLGLARTGVAAANYLAGQGADVCASDMKSSEELPLNSLHPAVAVRSGENHVRPGDTVVISPGIKPGTDAWKLAHQRGAEVISDIELFYRLCPCPIVAVTGTDGKSTTTALIGELLEAAGYRTFVGGNIGVACMEGLAGLSRDSVAVLEISCFQLTHCHSLNPAVAVITNIAEDHVEYHGSMEAYIEAKKRVFRNMGLGRRIVTNGDDPEISKWQFPAGVEIRRFGWDSSFPLSADGNSTYLEGRKVVDHSELKLQGLHNVENVMAALAAVEGRFCTVGQVLTALTEFPGLEHRMEFVATVNGVLFFNDSKATNPHAATAVLNAFPEKFWLLAGGYEKGSDFSELGSLVATKTKGVILFAQTRHRIRESIPEGFPVWLVETMDEAVKLSLDLAGEGDRVVLAPACASFGQFDDFEHRGRVFKQLVNSLLEDQTEPAK